MNKVRKLERQLKRPIFKSQTITRQFSTLPNHEPQNRGVTLNIGKGKSKQKGNFANQRTA